jgi:hypothetical protein
MNIKLFERDLTWYSQRPNWYPRQSEIKLTLQNIIVVICIPSRWLPYKHKIDMNITILKVSYEFIKVYTSLSV